MLRRRWMVDDKADGGGWPAVNRMEEVVESLVCDEARMVREARRGRVTLFRRASI